MNARYSTNLRIQNKVTKTQRWFCESHSGHCLQAGIVSLIQHHFGFHCHVITYRPCPSGASHIAFSDVEVSVNWGRRLVWSGSFIKFLESTTGHWWAILAVIYSLNHAYSGLIFSHPLTAVCLKCTLFIVGHNGLESGLHSLFFRSFPCVNLKKCLPASNNKLLFSKLFSQITVAQFPRECVEKKQCKPVYTQHYSDYSFTCIISIFSVFHLILYTLASLSANFAI